MNALSCELSKLARLQGQNKISIHLIDPLRGELLLASKNLPETIWKISDEKTLKREVRIFIWSAETCLKETGDKILHMYI